MKHDHKYFNCKIKPILDLGINFNRPAKVNKKLQNLWYYDIICINNFLTRRFLVKQ